MCTAAVSLLGAFLLVAVHASQQPIAHALRFDEFATLRHRLYPSHAVRVKKTKHCDGEVNAYSGYIDNEAKHLWFEFFESRRDPANDDIVFKTNGGPGTSSALGLYMEHGPCLFLDETGPQRNPYSWNERANVLYIHQPVNVGFSYAEHGESVYTTEEAVRDIAAFITILFDSEHFVHLNLAAPGRKLHMTGESYGGRYIPLFASAILDRNAQRVQDGREPISLVHHARRLVSIHDWLLRNAVYCSTWRSDAYHTNNHLRQDETSASTMLQRSAKHVHRSLCPFHVRSPTAAMRFQQSGDYIRGSYEYIASLLERGVRVLAYNGAYDFVCSWSGTQRWTDALEWSGAEAYRATKLQDWEVDGQSAGWWRGASGMTFVTIHAAGLWYEREAAPYDKPKEALVMLQRWLDGGKF
ncbi:alpha/beta-hydrolase [Exidia glandulosa HHB12029]|uniref:Carboxypeptidase n=1 Tax=Exidia glandulosa HHB12029 TaxID=1314781 RepID=A0A166MHD1_EXIGL|nr:alpha/beta-hydrolase [Exidia glandulosa HHB12029]